MWMDTEQPELGLSTLYQDLVAITFEIFRVNDKLLCKCQKYDIGQSECTVHTVTVSVASDSHRHVIEVTYNIGNSGNYSECTVHTVTVSVASDSHRHVIKVTYNIGNSGNDSECTVHTVTVSVASGSYRHVTEVTCDIQVGNSGSYVKCTVLTVTLCFRSDPSGNETEFMHAT